MSSDATKRDSLPPVPSMSEDEESRPASPGVEQDNRSSVNPPAFEWSEEDERWCAALLAPLRQTARRWGRGLTELVILAGTSQIAFEQLARNGAGNQRVAKALSMLGGGMNRLMSIAVTSQGFTPAQFAQCKREAELSIALHTATLQPGDRRSGGGILLS